MEHKRSGSVKKDSDLKNRMEEELVCEICQELLQQPITLNQCSHTFCQMCLTKWLNSKPLGSDLQPEQLECPKCRRVTTLPPEGVAGLPINHTLQNLADIARDGLEASGEVEQPVLPMCEQHQCLLNQYCIPCNELLCSECIHDPKHKEHLERGEIRLVRKILPECLEMLSKQLQPASDLGIQAKLLKEEVEKKSEVISSNAKEARESVNAFFREVVAQIEERRKVLISAIDKNVDGKLATLDQHSQRIEEAEASASSITSTVQRLCRSRDVHALTKAQVIQEQLLLSQQSLDGLNTQLQDKHLDLLKFQGDKVLETQLNNLGTLTVCETDPDSNYLTVKHRLRVQMDGNVFKDDPSVTASPGHFMPLISVGSDSETYLYASGQYGQATPTGVLPRNLATAAAMPRSPSEGALSTADYIYVSPFQNRLVLTPTHSPRPVRPRPNRIGNLQAIPSSQDEEMYESFQLSTSLPSGGVATAADDTDNPRQLRPTGRRRSSDVDNEEIKEGIYDNLACLEIYDEVETVEEGATGKPPLPPDRRNRSQTLPVKVEVCSIESSTSSERLEPETIQPVRIITSEQLCDPKTKDKVFPSGVSCSSAYDNVAFTDVHNHCLRIFREDGSLSLTIGSKGKANGQFVTPVTVLQQYNYLYVVDQGNGRVQKLTVQGKFCDLFGRKHLQSPVGIAIAQIGGDIYVSDSRQQCICVYRGNCKYARSITRRENNIPFDVLAGLAFDTAGNLLVADRGQFPCIWHISQEGVLLGTIGEGYLHEPCDVTVTKDGSIVVTEKGRMNCVTVFSPQGEVVTSFGKTGSQPGEFRAPSGLTVNGQGEIIVADQYNHRLQVFDLSTRQQLASEDSNNET